MPGSPDFFYRAFVSYSHEDDAVATAVTRALKRIAVPWYRPTRRIFRDEEELAPGERLPVLIQRELSRSAFLVVIASPHTARSSWVNREVEWWLEEAGRDPSSMIFILAEGDLARGIPPAAADWAAAEPLAVDLRLLAESQTFSLRSRPFVAAMAGAVARLDAPKTKQQIINAQRGQRRHALQALALASTLLCGLIAVSLVLGLTVRSQGNLVNSQSSALSAGQKALNARQRAILAASLSAKAAQVRDSDPQTAIKLDLAALAIDGTPAIRDSLVTTLTSDHFTGLAEAGSGGIEATAESSDGRSLLTAGRDGTVRLWNIADRTDPAEVATIYSGPADSTNAVAFGPGHSVLVGAGDDVRVIDITDPAHPRLLAHLRHAPGDFTEVKAIDTSPDGTIAINASLGSEISVWSIGGGSRVRQIGRIGSAVNIHAMAVAPNMQMLAVGSLLDGRAQLVDLRNLADPRPVINWPAHAKPVDSLAFSPDGRYLATGGLDGQLKIWELRGTLAPAMLYHRALPGPVGTIAFSPDGTSLAAGTGDGTVRIFGLSDIRRPVVRAVLAGHTDAVTAAVFSPDGHTLVTAGEDGRLLTWELDTLPAPSQLSVLALPGDEVFADAFSPHGGVLAAGGVDGTVSTWDVHDPRRPGPRAALRGTGMVSAMAFSPSGQLLAVGSGKNILIFAMTAAGGYQLDERFAADRSLVDHLSFGATDQYLFSSGNNGQVQVSALRPHRPPAFTRPFLSGAELLGVSSTHVLAAVTGSRELSLWDVTDPAHPRFLKAAATPHTDIIEAGGFSSDGHVLATAGRDRQTVLWNVSDPRRPRPLSTLTRQNGDIDAVAFSPDRHLLATGSYDKTTVLWNVTAASQPSPVAVLTGQSDWVAAVAFDAHGHLATASRDGTIILWDTAALDQAITSPVSQACAITGTGLSRRQWAQYTNGYPYRPTCKPPSGRR